MTVSSTTNKSGPYLGNGSTVEFDYEFRILDPSHLTVIMTEGGVDTPVSHSDFTVAGVGASGGGSLTFLAAPVTGQSITIIRNAPFTQPTDLENQGAYYAETVEGALDLGVMRDQQLAEGLSRAVQIPIGADPSALGGLIEDIIRLSDSAGEIDIVAGIAANVTTVAGISANVTTVAGIAANVTTVAGIAADVTAVADIAADVTMAADNIAAIVAAPGHAAAAATARDEAEDARDAAVVAKDAAETAAAAVAAVKGFDPDGDVTVDRGALSGPDYSPSLDDTYFALVRGSTGTPDTRRAPVVGAKKISGSSAQGHNPTAYYMAEKRTAVANTSAVGLYGYAIDYAGSADGSAFIEGIRGGAVIATGAVNGVASGGIFAAGCSVGVAYKTLVAVEGDVIQNSGVDASEIEFFNKSHFAASFLATSNFGTNNPDVAFMVNPWQGANTAFMAGFFVPQDSIDATLGVAFVSDATGKTGMDLSRGTWSSAAIKVPNASSIRAMNAAKSATLNVLYLSNTDEIVLGQEAPVYVPQGRIRFPAAQVPSTDPNTLDDYEEGTFTPVIVGTGTAGAGTYSVQDGKYTKIGRVVHFEGRVAWSAHTGTTNMIINGLPFAVSAAPSAKPCAIMLTNIAFTGQAVGSLGAFSSTGIDLYTMATNAAPTRIAIDTSGEISFSGSYTV